MGKVCNLRCLYPSCSCEKMAERHFAKLKIMKDKSFMIPSWESTHTQKNTCQLIKRKRNQELKTVTVKSIKKKWQRTLKPIKFLGSNMKNCQMGTQLNSKSENMFYMKNKSEFYNK